MYRDARTKRTRASTNDFYRDYDRSPLVAIARRRARQHRASQRQPVLARPVDGFASHPIVIESLVLARQHFSRLDDSHGAQPVVQVLVRHEFGQPRARVAPQRLVPQVVDQFRRHGRAVPRPLHLVQDDADGGHGEEVGERARGARLGRGAVEVDGGEAVGAGDVGGVVGGARANRRARALARARDATGRGRRGDGRGGDGAHDDAARGGRAAGRRRVASIQSASGDAGAAGRSKRSVAHSATRPSSVDVNRDGTWAAPAATTAETTLASEAPDARRARLSAPTMA